MKHSLPIIADDEELIPVYATEEAAGADLKANIQQDLIIQPNETALIPTGIKLEIPRGFEVQLRPRSGLALKNSITVLNSPATIDSDYRGEIKIILINHSKVPFTVTPKMRIAQMVLCPVFQAQFVMKEELVATTRGEGGFGHTGTR